jgi:hypothetical protein
MLDKFKELIRSVRKDKDFCRPEHGITFPPDIPTYQITIFKKIQPYTMTSSERVFALCEAVSYVHKHGIEGDIVECGVWKGGSMMAIAETLLSLKNTDRYLYLFDTFEGMPPPTEPDRALDGESAEEILHRSDKTRTDSAWCRAPLDLVKNAIKGTGYPIDKIHFIKGMVEQTIPASAPKKIALLRLDTDWYESTRHEMIHLFPRLVKGGVLIIDDYGHWQGARKAVDEYLDENNIKIMLARIDYTGRIAVKID